jgi:hypothetical protein
MDIKNVAPLAFAIVVLATNAAVSDELKLPNLQ